MSHRVIGLLKRRRALRQALDEKSTDAAAELGSDAVSPQTSKNRSSEPPAAFEDEFEQQALEAWNDDSIELSAEYERHIEQARERVLSFAKDQALLDWLDEPDPLSEYLRLEAVMLEFDASGQEKLADDARDQMDPLWWALSDAQRELLNSRKMIGSSDELTGCETKTVPGRLSPASPGVVHDMGAGAPDLSLASIVHVTGDALDANVPKQGYGPEEVFKRFLMNRSDDTLKAYKADVDAFAAWLGVSSDDAIGRLLGHGLGPANALVIEWLDSMRELSPATRKRRLSALRSVVRMARRLGAVEWSLDVDSPKAEAYRDTAGPTEHEFHKLLAACGEGLEGLRNRALVLLAVLMAFRRRELAAFRIRDFDRDRRRVFVRGKGDKNKWIGVPDEVFEALVAWLGAPKTIVGEGNDAIFLSLSPRTFGQPLTRKGVYNIVTKIGERAGVKVWPHALRHAGITAALDASNGDVRMSQQFGRHADPKTTMIYDDNRTDMAGRAAKLVAGKLMPK